MNKFNLLKYLSKWKYLIFAVCVLGALIVYKYAMYNQEYTASTVISYTGQNAADGKTPSGDDIDVTEIYSAAVITNVLEDLNLNIGADAIRSKCKVTEIIPPDEEVKKQALLEAGEEYTYFPTDYVVSFSVGSEYSQDFARTVLDSIIKNYFATYGEKYINQQTLPNNNVRGTDGQYDYIERVEILDAWALNISDYLAAKKETQPNYRSAETGYSFSDLYEIYKSYIDYDIPQIYSLILEQEVTGDKETLIKKYQSDISTYELDLQNMEEKINDLNDLITKYSDKNKEGVEYHYGTQSDEGNDASDYILKNVYDEWNQEDGHVQSETTYDTLINEYVDIETEKEKLEVDLEHKKKLLAVFTDGAQSDDMSNKDEIEQSLEELSQKLGDMYSSVSTTVDEYNQYIGAYNVSTLSSISTSEKINVKMYIVLAIIIFFFGGCIGAIILGRSKDFLDYIMYTDRKTGLPNRAMCDIEIEKYAADKLKDSFVFLLIKLDNLKYVNDKGGREAGDALLKVFGKVLKRAASSYGFVGYNGSDQFIGMFEECTVQRAEDFKQYLEELVHYHNVQTPNVTMQVSVAVSETNSEQIYDIRKLMGATFRKASAQQPRREAENKSEDKKEENKEEKKRHIFIYNAKVYLVVAFCFAVVTAFSLLFWAFAQQGGSSISLYIDRFVNRHIMSYEVPTAMFQSINAFAVMLCGMVLAWLVKESVNGNRTLRIWGKFALGLGLMSAGFCILTLSARWSAAYGQSSMPLMVLGLAVMGFAELFIDPVAMSQITRIEIPGVTGVLTGIYMLLSGAIANYLAGVIADQTSQASFDAAGAVNYSIDAYITVFSQITWGALACVGVVLVIWLYHSLKVRTRRLAVE